MWEMTKILHCIAKKMYLCYYLNKGNKLSYFRVLNEGVLI